MRRVCTSRKGEPERAADSEPLLGSGVCLGLFKVVGPLFSRIVRVLRVRDSESTTGLGPIFGALSSSKLSRCMSGWILPRPLGPGGSDSGESRGNSESGGRPANCHSGWQPERHLRHRDWQPNPGRGVRRGAASGSGLAVFGSSPA
jgi:hypothetical protein